MGTVELRNKWKEAIGKVDDRFLRMVDALYETYSKDQVDFFEELGFNQTWSKTQNHVVLILPPQLSTMTVSSLPWMSG